MSLTVIKNEAIPGTTRWANEVRREAQRLVMVMDTSYIEVGRILTEIHDTKFHNGGPVWQTWGYTSFGDYAWRELQVLDKRAERYMRIYRRLFLDKDMEAMTTLQRDRLLRLGFTKLLIMIRVVTLDNIEDWLLIAEKAETSYRDLERLAQDAVREHLALLQQQAEGISEDAEEGEAEQARSRAVPLSESQLEDGAADRPESSDQDEARARVTSRQAAKSALNSGLSVPNPKERLTFRRFGFTQESWGIVRDALQRMQQVSGSESDGYNLSLLALGMLAQAQYGRKGDRDKAISLYVPQLEKWLGVRLVVLDGKKPEVRYGYDSLKALSEQVGAVTEEEGQDDAGDEGEV